MSNKLKKHRKSNDTLRACYFRQRGYFMLFFEVGNVTEIRNLYYPFFRLFDFNGLKMEHNISQLATELNKYGIYKSDIERVIIEACNEAHESIPKYLRTKKR